MDDGFHSPMYIRDLEQWKLLENICPLFAFDHPWTGITDCDTKMIGIWAPVFKVEISAIPAIININNGLTQETYEEFEHQIDILLSNLQLLVDDKTVSELARISENASRSCDSSDIKDKYPHLLDLDALRLDYKQSAASGEYSKYVRLDQNAETFKHICWKVSAASAEMAQISSKAMPIRPQLAPDARVLKKTPQNRQSHKFWGDSANALFNALVTHLKQCNEMLAGGGENVGHKAMLRLKQAQDLQNNEPDLEVGLVLASCQAQETWYPMLFKISPKDEACSPALADPPVKRICNGEMSWRQRVFKFQEQSFHDVSDSHPTVTVEADPTKRLSELLASGILKDRYRFTPLDKKILALTLAYALLQFYDGPWAQTLWTPENIFFMFEEKGDTVSNIREPYVSCVLSQPPPQMGSIDEDHRYPLIFCFAKLLIELETGEEIKAESARKGQKPSLLYSVSKRHGIWSGEQLDVGCDKALDACLKFGKLRKEHEFENPGATVQDLILTYIVDPLKARISKEYRGEHRSLSLEDRSSVTSDTAGNVRFAQRDIIISSEIEQTPDLTQAPTPSANKPTTAVATISQRPSVWNIIGDKIWGHRLPPQPLHLAIPKNSSLDKSNVYTASTYPTTGSINRNVQNAKHVYPHATISSSKPVFGKTLSQKPNLTENISETSFKYINDTVAERLLHQEDDKVIKIAILDTGFDFKHEDFQQARTVNFYKDQPNPAKNEPSQLERIAACHDFCYEVADNASSGYKSTNCDDVEDFDGHGTKVAGIVLRLAPHAKLFVARICVGENSDRIPKHLSYFQKPRPEVAARAVEWAIREEVHIINMSFGFRRYSHEQLIDLTVALEKARNSNIITFAATSNDGFHEDVAWPANDSALAIGIHSCTDSGGTKSEFTAMASSNGVNFMVVGEKILSQQLMSRGGGFCLCSGVSFATPVATAIGAIILTFAWQEICEENRDIAKPEIVKQICTKDGMIKMLKAISKRVDQDYWSLSTKVLWADYHDTGYEDEMKAREHAWNIIIKALRP